MSLLENVTYKELQFMAKERKIPANLKRSELISALNAFDDGDFNTVENIKSQHKRNRNKRASVTKSNDPSVTTRKARKKKPYSRAYETEDEEEIDLSNKDRELIPYRIPSVYYKGTSYLDTTATANAQPRFPLFNRRNTETQCYKNNSSLVTDCSKIPPPTSSLALNNFLPISSSSASYQSPMPNFMQRSTVQETYNYPETGTCALYRNNSTIYRAPLFHPSMIAGCGYENNGCSYSKDVGYYSQNPANVRMYESNYYGSVSEMNFEHLQMYSLPKKNTPQIPATDADYSSLMLPSIPELMDNGEGNVDSSVMWSQNNMPVDGNLRNSSEIKTSNNTFRNIYEKKVDLHNRISTEQVTDSVSVDVEFDSSSDTETLSLPEEIASLFESENNNSKKNAAPQQVPFLDYIRAKTMSSTNYPATFMCNRFSEPENLVKVINENVGKTDLRGNGDRNIAIEQMQNNNEQSLVLVVPPGASSVSSTLPECNTLPPISSLLPTSYTSTNAYEEFSCRQDNLMSRPPRNVPYFGEDLQYNESSYQYAPHGNVIPTATSETNDLSSKVMERTQKAAPVENTNLSNKNFGVSYLATSSHKNSILRNYLRADEFSPTSSVSINEPIVTSSVTDDAPQDAFDKTLEQQLNLKIGHSNVNEVATTLQNLSVEREVVDAARLIYERETISIQDSAANGNVKKDMILKSLQIVIPSPISSHKTPINPNEMLLSESVHRLKYCKYKSEGCEVVLSNNTQVHEKECAYQSVYCPLDSCPRPYTMYALSSHVYQRHREDLNYGNDFVYLIDRTEYDEKPFITYFQLCGDTICVIKIHIDEITCVATIQYVPEIENRMCKKKHITGIMQLIYFSRDPLEVERKCWKGLIQPFFENDDRSYEESNVLQSSVGDSKYIILRVLTDYKLTP